MTPVTSKTRLLGVIGHPVSHSLSPLMHNAELERLQLDYVYVAWDVAAAAIGDAVRGFRATGVAGFNITIPHKESVMEHLDEVTPDALAVGAVNTVINREGLLIGYNTDVHGWADDVMQDIALSGSRVCILGGGGASRAVCVGAAMHGASTITILSRTLARAQEIVTDVQPLYPDVAISAVALEDGGRDAVAGKDIIVNATPVGMAVQPGTPIPVEWIETSTYVYDTIYRDTELLSSARELGCRTRNGVGMLARQGALAFEIWTGQKPDVARMQALLEAAIK